MAQSHQSRLKEQQTVSRLKNAISCIQHDLEHTQSFNNKMTELDCMVEQVHSKVSLL